MVQGSVRGPPRGATPASVRRERRIGRKRPVQARAVRIKNSGRSVPASTAAFGPSEPVSGALVRAIARGAAVLAGAISVIPGGRKLRVVWHEYAWQVLRSGRRRPPEESPGRSRTTSARPHARHDQGPCRESRTWSVTTSVRSPATPSGDRAPNATRLLRRIGGTGVSGSVRGPVSRSERVRQYTAETSVRVYNIFVATTAIRRHARVGSGSRT